MKKFLLLLVLFIPEILFAQNILQNGGMESWDNDSLIIWSSEEGTTITQEKTIVKEGFNAARFHLNTRTQNKTDFRQKVHVEGGMTYQIKVDVYQLDNRGKTRIFAQKYYDYSDPELINKWQTITYHYNATETGEIEVGLRFYDVLSSWNDKGSDIIIDNFRMYKISSLTVEEVSNIAELRSATKDGIIYKLTNEVILTMQVNDYKHQKWIQDLTGAIEIYDVENKITTLYNLNDGITGLEGILKDLNGTLQFIPTKNPEAATSTDNTLEPKIISINEFITNFNNYESQLVQLNGVSSSKSGLWEYNTNYDFYQTDSSTVRFTVRSHFDNVNYIGTSLSQKSKNVAGIVLKYQGTPQLAPRSKEDIMDITSVSAKEIESTISDILIFVRDKYLIVKNADVKIIKVFTVKGQEVLREENKNTTDISVLKDGTYLIHLVTKEGEVKTTKIVKS